MIWLSNTLRDQPHSAAACAYQSRSDSVSSLSNSTMMWPEGKFGGRLLPNLVGPRLGGRAHVPQVAMAEATRARERDLEILGKPVDHRCAASLGPQTIQDRAAAAPVRADEFSVDDTLRTPPGVGHGTFALLEEVEGYQIVHAIACSEVTPTRIMHRDTTNYMGILLDDNNRKPITRLHSTPARSTSACSTRTRPRHDTRSPPSRRSTTTPSTSARPCTSTSEAVAGWRRISCGNPTPDTHPIAAHNLGLRRLLAGWVGPWGARAPSGAQDRRGVGSLDPHAT
ncbi:hypothetical protein OCAE111667_04185 [Occultella aeris]|uniref:Uncharacterized protein n=1 Tax=Occultella aeris TaxID=2761496 RepID=A0A7M4DG76_9MICO|nr:hypothetical protein HALOF300_01122 [Occultella aeris]